MILIFYLDAIWNINLLQSTKDVEPLFTFGFVGREIGWGVEDTGGLKIFSLEMEKFDIVDDFLLGLSDSHHSLGAEFIVEWDLLLMLPFMFFADISMIVTYEDFISSEVRILTVLSFVSSL
jgi:hypothetical protein